MNNGEGMNGGEGGLFQPPTASTNNVLSGKCGKICRRHGNPCTHSLPCPYHAASEEEQCQSCLDQYPNEQCLLPKMPGAQYCNKHWYFPNLGKELKDWLDRFPSLPDFNSEQFMLEKYEGRKPAQDLLELAQHLCKKSA